MSLRTALIGGALITIAVGVFLYLAVDEMIGIALVAIGVVDLVTIPLVLGMMERNRARSASPSEPPPVEADPSYNPYARED
jgi:hypothetical protein